MPAPGNAKCVLQVFLAGESDTALWYRLWEAATAVYSICARDKKKGVSRGLGEYFGM